MTSEECIEVAEELFKTIRGKGCSPKDAAEIVVYVHLLTWLNQRRVNSPAHVMLDAYKEVFLETLGMKFSGETLQ